MKILTEILQFYEKYGSKVDENTTKLHFYDKYGLGSLILKSWRLVPQILKIMGVIFLFKMSAFPYYNVPLLDNPGDPIFNAPQIDI